MTKEIMGKTAFSAAYAAWFSRYETERRHQKKRRGSHLTNFPEPPASPDSIAALIDEIGASRVLSTLGVHRSTVARWLAGSTVIPRPCYLLLVLMAQGRLPGMSDDWRDFRFVGDTLYQIGTRVSYTAREIAGWPYQMQHARALSHRVNALEKEKAHLLKIGTFEAANDPLIKTG